MVSGPIRESHTTHTCTPVLTCVHQIRLLPQPDEQRWLDASSRPESPLGVVGRTSLVGPHLLPSRSTDPPRLLLHMPRRRPPQPSEQRRPWRPRQRHHRQTRRERQLPSQFRPVRALHTRLTVCKHHCRPTGSYTTPANTRSNSHQYVRWISVCFVFFVARGLGSFR